MNLAEVENVFGTLSSIPSPEKKGSLIPVILLLVIVGIGIAITLDHQNKSQSLSENH